jgi:hypothetical protein
MPPASVRQCTGLGFRSRFRVLGLGFKLETDLERRVVKDRDCAVAAPNKQLTARCFGHGYNALRHARLRANVLEQLGPDVDLEDVA